jgi:hypothetical protein
MGVGWLRGGGGGGGVGVGVILRNMTSRSDFPLYSQRSLKFFL